MPWSVYLVRCADGSLYAGIAKDVAARVEKHNAGTGAKYTRSRRPVVLAYEKKMRSESAARKREARIKRLPKAEKENLTRIDRASEQAHDEWVMKNLFKKGMILGGLLSAAALVGLAQTKKGQELTEDLKQELKPLVKQLKKSLHAMEDITKDAFDELSAKIVAEYAKDKKLAADAQEKLTKALQSTWNEMEETYKNA